MKKTISIILSLALMLSVFAACSKSNSNQASTAPADSAQTDEIVNGFKTIGDAMSYDKATLEQSGSVDNKYVYAFSIDGAYYRVIATMPQEVMDKVYALDASKEDYEEKYNALVEPLNIDKWENLSNGIMTQEQLDKLAGKTIGDLLNDGWTYNGYEIEGMTFNMNHDVYQYTVKVEGKIDDIEKFQENEEENMKPLVIQSVTYTGLGDVTALTEAEA